MHRKSGRSTRNQGRAKCGLRRSGLLASDARPARHPSTVRGGLSTKGRTPHFKVSPKTPHKLPSCPPRPKAVSPSGQGTGTVQVPGVLGAGGVKVIKYKKPTPLGLPTPVPPNGLPGTPVTKPATRYVPGGTATPNQEEPTYLDEHLRLLRNAAGYPGPALRVKVAGLGEFKGQDYFCHFEAATHALAAKTHNGHARLMAYWGQVHKAVSQGSLFLNSKGIREGTGGMAIQLPEETAKVFLSELGLTDHNALDGHWVIAEGRLGTDKYGKTRILVIEDTVRIAVQQP
jgi:hypothetical protein